MLFPPPCLSCLSLSFVRFDWLVMISTVLKFDFFTLKNLFWFFLPEYQFPCHLSHLRHHLFFFLPTWLYFHTLNWFPYFIHFISLLLKSFIIYVWILNSLSNISTTLISRVGSWEVVIFRGPELPWFLTSPSSVWWSGYLLILLSKIVLRSQSLPLPREEKIYCCKSYSSNPKKMQKHMENQFELTNAPNKIMGQSTAKSHSVGCKDKKHLE